MSAWNEIKEAAQDAQDASDACSFTSFVAYEWSASPGTRNLHRNVIFRSDRVPALPFTYLDGNQEEQLWTSLETECLERDGCEVLTIPHNSNLSAGLIFETIDRNGKPFDKAYAERRRKFEPLVEIFQHKGSSECVPERGADELCNYELSPYDTLGSTTLGGTPDKLVAADFVRDALVRRLRALTGPLRRVRLRAAGLRHGCADGRRAQWRRQHGRTQLRALGPARSGRHGRAGRPAAAHANHQMLGRAESDPIRHLRRRRCRQRRRSEQLRAARGGCRRALQRVDRPQVRPLAARLLLRPRAGEPELSLADARVPGGADRLHTAGCRLRGLLRQSVPCDAARAGVDGPRA
ncbi:MAG: hypothetical protein JWN04_6403 [Myxococcaceae bacterium]|nr:hypothetical protein [Myxococcaceae bacterium]